MIKSRYSVCASYPGIMRRGGFPQRGSKGVVCVCRKEVGLALPNLEKVMGLLEKVVGLLEKVMGRYLLLHIKVSNLSL